MPAGAGRVSVVGPAERNLKLLREVLGVHVSSRDGKIVLSGTKPAVTAARRVLDALRDAAESSTPLSKQQVLEMITEEASQVDARAARAGGDEIGDSGESFDDDTDWGERLNVYVGGKPIRPKTPNQATYLRAIRDFDLVFGLGPAGTGKTYLAVAAAVHMLKSGMVKRVVLTRPAVEAGEKLGFLPGDLREKVNPYLRPLFDALHDMMDYSTARRFMDNDVVEVVPLAFMRGRTLNHSVVILDEAQNATKGQMMMFLTRMGQGSKMIVTGDPSQTDLEDGTESGLIDAARRLARTDGVAFVGFEPADIVRHDLVRRIIAAYGDMPQPRRSGAARGRGRVNSPDNAEPDGVSSSMRVTDA